MPELKPCPFCDGEAELIWNAVGGLAGCFNENCPVNATTPTYYVGAEYESEAAAEPHIIEAWNTRAERTCRNDDGWCSECEHYLHDGFKWCPWCGAKIEKGDGE